MNISDEGGSGQRPDPQPGPAPILPHSPHHHHSVSEPGPSAPPPPPSPPPPPGTVSQPTGPSSSGSFAGTSGTGGAVGTSGGIGGGSVQTADPAPSLFEGYPGPEIDAATTLVTQFMGYMGWPQGIDANQMALYLMQNNLVNNPVKANQSLFFSNFFSDTQRKSAPWAQFGITSDQFSQRSRAVDTLFFNLVGSGSLTDSLLKNPSGTTQHLLPRSAQMFGNADNTPANYNQQLEQLYRTAIANNWSQADLMSAMQQNSVISAEQPWLATGQTYESVYQSYVQTYGSTIPLDSKSMASYFKFNQAASHLGGSYAAPERSLTPTLTQTEAR